MVLRQQLFFFVKRECDPETVYDWLGVGRVYVHGLVDIFGFKQLSLWVKPTKSAVFEGLETNPKIKEKEAIGIKTITTTNCFVKRECDPEGFSVILWGGTGSSKNIY